MDWRDEAIEEVVERREGSGGRLRRDGTVGAEASGLTGPWRRRRKWSRTERWLREQLRRPGAWLLLGAIWLVVPASFGALGNELWWTIGQWSAGCVYLGLAYHAVRRHVAFGPAVMVALGCAVNGVTVLAVAGWGDGVRPWWLWEAVLLLTGMLALETLRDATWRPMRCAGLAAAGGLVVVSSGDTVAGWVILVAGCGLSVGDVVSRRVEPVAGRLGVFGLIGGSLATLLAWGWWVRGINPWEVPWGAFVWLAYALDAGYPGPALVGWLVTLPYVAGGAVLSWMGLLGPMVAISPRDDGVLTMSGPIWVAGGVIAGVGWLALVWGWWRWTRRSGGLLVLCCPWVLALAGWDGFAVVLALMPMGWLTVWLFVRRYRKRRLTVMAGLVGLQALLSGLPWLLAAFAQ